MEEVVISGPGYDPTSTNVPGYTQEQLQSFIDGTNKGPVPDGAQSKANSWHRVTKVVSIQLPVATGKLAGALLTLTQSSPPLQTTVARRKTQDERLIENSFSSQPSPI